MRWFILIVGISLALARTAYAQVAFPSSKTASRMVTILSDGNSEPNGAASQILSDIAITLDKQSDMRVLSMNGYGGPLNARDLLQLRGADLAVINNDVLAYLDLLKTLPEARRKVRLIAPLFHQRVLFFARQGVNSIEELRGRKVGIPPATRHAALRRKQFSDPLKSTSTSLNSMTTTSRRERRNSTQSSSSRRICPA